MPVSCRSHEPDAAPLVARPRSGRVDELTNGVLTRTKVGPEAIDLACRLAGVREDVVKTDEAPAFHERRIHLEVVSHALVRMVTVDEEEVDGRALELRDETLSRRRIMRVRAEKRQLLLGACESGQPRDVIGLIASAEFAAGEIDAHDPSVRRRELAPKPQRAAPVRTDL